MMAQQSVLTVNPSLSSNQALAMVQPYTVSASTTSLQFGSTSTLNIGLVDLDSGYNGSKVASEAFTSILQGINDQAPVIMKITMAQ